ncbi:MAG: hypothetical protein LBL67_04175 [Coriobacteriales bacterium]|jgi:hypothetical protein|nr:hypothetical protein [Coriobacteriales bacterium]
MPKPPFDSPNPTEAEIIAKANQLEAEAQRRDFRLGLAEFGRDFAKSAQNQGIAGLEYRVRDYQPAYGGEGLGLRFTRVCEVAEERCLAWRLLEVPGGEVFLISRSGALFVAEDAALCRAANQEDYFYLELCTKKAALAEIAQAALAGQVLRIDPLA